MRTRFTFRRPSAAAERGNREVVLLDAGLVGPVRVHLRRGIRVGEEADKKGFSVELREVRFHFGHEFVCDCAREDDLAGRRRRGGRA